MTALFPAIEPNTHGMLDVGDGHLVYWEECGNPEGKPVVVLHGGPGSGCTAQHRRYFDPRAYRIILFDQRGCGRSTPNAGNTVGALSNNTTQHLVRDMEVLRVTLNIDRWVLFGGSWGATLALVYAQARPECVSSVILVGVTMTRQSEIDWLYHGARSERPEEWQRFKEGAADAEGDLVQAYHDLLIHPSPLVHGVAAKHWCDWEWSLVSSNPNAKRGADRLAPAFQLMSARLITHYFSHGAWLENNQLLNNASALAGIPGRLIQGEQDLQGPAHTAQELAAVWPEAKLTLVSGAGHSANDTGMQDAILAATREFID